MPSEDVVPLSDDALQPGSGFTFTQGVVVGQASIILLVIAFLRYVVFEQPAERSDPQDPQTKASSTASRKRKKKKRRASIVLPSSDAHLLQRLKLNLTSHPAEPADWLNVLLAQTISGYRTAILNSNAEEGGAKGYVERMLNKSRAPDESASFISLDKISVGEVDFGDDFPVLSNARIRPSDDTGRVRVEVDADYSDHISLSIDTKVFVNFPKPRFAILPVSLGMTLARFTATITLELPVENLGAPPTLYLSLLPDFTLDLQTSSLIGSTAKLQDIPKVEQLLAGRMRSLIHNKLVWPNSKCFKLPDLGNTSRAEEDVIVPPEDDWVEVDAPNESWERQELAGQPYKDADADLPMPEPPLFPSPHARQAYSNSPTVTAASSRPVDWRHSQLRASLINYQHGYNSPWPTSSPLFSPSASLAASTNVRSPNPSLPRSETSEFALPGHFPSSSNLRYRRPNDAMPSGMRPSSNRQPSSAYGRRDKVRSQQQLAADAEMSQMGA